MKNITNLYIIDPNLVDNVGHYLPYAHSVSYEARERGCEVVWLVSKNFKKQNAPSDVHVKELFHSNIFDEDHLSGKDAVNINFQQYNKKFYQDLLTSGVSKTRNCLFLFPNVLHNQLHAILEWSNLIDETSRALIVLRWNNALMPYNIARNFSDDILRLYKLCLLDYRERYKKAFVSSDTLRLASFYSRLANCQVYFIPSPQTHANITEFDSSLLNTRAREELTLGFYGSHSNLRGSHLIPEIINSVIDRYEHVYFRCQVPHITSLANDALIKLQAQRPNRITLLSGTLDYQLYYFCIRTTSLILMPYSPDFYGWGSSGVACEALSLGVPGVISKNTTMEDEYRLADAGYRVSACWTTESFVAATLEAISSIQELSKLSSEAIEKYVNANSPKAFFEKIDSIIDN